jgi:putative membrane protein
MKPMLALLALAVPLLALGAESTPDKHFLRVAAEGGNAEIRDAMLANDKSNSQAVKDFAAMIIKDHTAADQKLQSIANAENISLPSHDSMKEGAEYAKLKVLSGDTFDKSYIKGQIHAHRQAIAAFRKEMSFGSDDQLKDFARDTLPTLEAHLKQARELASSEGVETK